MRGTWLDRVFVHLHPVCTAVPEFVFVWEGGSDTASLADGMRAPNR